MAIKILSDRFSETSKFVKENLDSLSDRAGKFINTHQSVATESHLVLDPSEQSLASSLAPSVLGYTDIIVASNPHSVVKNYPASKIQHL